MPLKPGVHEKVSGNSDSMTDSMAAAMEEAFNAALSKVVNGADPKKGQSERRLLFSAIAQGLVQHLQAHPDAFKVLVGSPFFPGFLSGQVTEIESDG